MRRQPECVCFGKQLNSPARLIRREAFVGGYKNGGIARFDAEKNLVHAEFSQHGRHLA